MKATDVECALVAAESAARNNVGEDRECGDPESGPSKVYELAQAAREDNLVRNVQREGPAETRIPRGVAFFTVIALTPQSFLLIRAVHSAAPLSVSSIRLTVLWQYTHIKRKRAPIPPVAAATRKKMRARINPKMRERKTKHDPA